ncbi:MAG: universal stress protein [Actinomycetota bacterium]|nr:universal stress protein [Actinomycetota bacterium]
MNATTTKPIMICYDGSEGASRAIEKAGELFPAHSAIVLHAWSPVAIICAAYGGAVALPSYDDETLEQEATKIAEAGCRLARDGGLNARPEIAEVTYQGTWHTILDIADEYDAELIVLGARGLSAFKFIMLGSVSHSVTKHAHLPVLIVPPAVREQTAVSEPAGHAAAPA